MNKKKLNKVPIINSSGFLSKKGSMIKPLRKGNYYVVEEVFITGDAPKDFIRVYEYGSARKDQPQKWTPYIAKVGHKWYPIESVTEYLMNRIGEVMGMNMAISRLMLAEEQIRFLSRYFLKKDQILVHGAQIFSAYLSDENFVEEIEKKGLARDFFTFQFAEEAIRNQFPEIADHLISEFVKMLMFDAIVGNSDRHFYNWGVIVEPEGKYPPHFSPIYDTARGLFWNEHEQKIIDVVNTPDKLGTFLRKYVKNSVPKTGWEGEHNINHFKLIELIYQQDKRYCYLCEEMVKNEHLSRIDILIDKEFS